MGASQTKHSLTVTPGTSPSGEGCDGFDWLQEARRVASLYEPPPIGRPSEAITDIFRVHKLLKLVAAGNYMETAVRAAGFAKQTLYNWRRQAEEGNVAAIALVDALEKAEAIAEAETLDNVSAASKLPQFWAAGMTKLERRYPDRWGRRQDDNSAPRVVVQIGVRDGDVRVSLGGEAPLSPATFAPEAGRNPDANLLSDKAFAISSSPIIKDNVNLGDSVPAAAGSQILARDLDGAPSMGGRRLAGRTGAAQAKGVRRGRKEKSAS